MTTAYRDWRGRRVQVSDETLTAVLAALGPEPSPPDQGPGAGQHTPQPAGTWPSQGHPSGDPVAPACSRRAWGFTVQLYSVRSRWSWGHGDMRDRTEYSCTVNPQARREYAGATGSPEGCPWLGQVPAGGGVRWPASGP